MRIIDRFEYHYTVEKSADIIGRGRVNPTLLREVEWAIERIKELWQPRAVVETTRLDRIDGETVSLIPADGGQPVELAVGPKADLLAPAQEVEVCVSTIGPQAEDEAKRLMAEGEMMKGYVLDHVAILALGEVTDTFRHQVEQTAAERGWGVGPYMAPGSLRGWPVSDQDNLTSLVDLALVGVSLTDSHLMLPFKSASSAIGLGPDYTEAKVGSVCQWCNHFNDCWRRRQD